MAGYPDSHLSPNAARPGRPLLRLILMATPILAACVWLCYVWFIMAVFPATEKYPGGGIKAEGYVRRAGLEEYKRHGHWVTFHENGQKESEGTYAKGEKRGTWVYWDAEGRKIREEKDGEADP